MQGVRTGVWAQGGKCRGRGTRSFHRAGGEGPGVRVWESGTEAMGLKGTGCRVDMKQNLT